MNPGPDPRDPGALPPRIPPRAADTHKGDYGHLLIIGGSPGLTGAACLAAEAAMRAGAGLVTVAIAERLNPILEIKLTEAMTRPLPEAPDGSPTGEALEALLAGPPRFDGILVGPGIGRGPGPRRLAARVLREAGTPLLLDADALWCLAQDRALLEAIPSDAILTPHPGEFARLTGTPAAAIQADRPGHARAFARRRGGVLILKGHGTVVTDGDRLWINPTGNPGMATGGSGDVLAGIAGALRVQGWDAYEAARLGVYLHGLAGDLAAREVGMASLVASDLIRSLPAAMRAHAQGGA